MEKHFLQILYRSELCPSCVPEDLLKIFLNSREKNKTLGITGAMAFREGHIMHLLDGPKDAVLGLFDKISLDKRHHSVLLLGRAEGASRLFENDHSTYFTAIAEVPSVHDVLQLIDLVIKDGYTTSRSAISTMFKHFIQNSEPVKLL